jgi:hypothetical protein
MLFQKHKRLLSVLGFCLLFILISAAIARQTRPVRDGRLDAVNPLARPDLIMHDVGNVTFTLSNYGECGNPNTTVGFTGFEFPINSGNDFLFSAGVWIGANVNGQRYVVPRSSWSRAIQQLENRP